MKLFFKPALLIGASVIVAATPARAVDCPQGTYRMIVENGVKCVPYANGGPSKPGPGPSQSTITGRSGPGSGSGSSTVRSAQ